MKVRDLIEGAVWHQGAKWEALNPEISILMPVYQSLTGAPFVEALESILKQSFASFELIVVDDGSTDGTFETLLQYMEKDPRISCIRHARNIGLPAVSMWEAFEKSRGRYIAFAFHDFVFERNALERLLGLIKEKNKLFVHGYAELVSDSRPSSERVKVLGKRVGFSFYEDMRIHNEIPNAAVLVERTVFSTVGLFDPHVVLVRLCDWDLWLRIMETCEILSVDVFVGREHGIGLKNSLGNTLPMDLQAVREYMRAFRDKRLLPECFGDFDVLSVMEGASDRLLRFRSASMLRFVESGLIPATPLPRRVLIVPSYDASTHLVFDAILEQATCVSLFHFRDDPEGFLAAAVEAAAVVVCRDIYILEADGFLKKLSQLGVPIYHFLDDNFWALHDQVPGLQGYKPERYAARVLPYIAGVISNSAAILSAFHGFFGDRAFHLRLMEAKVALPSRLLRSASPTPPSGKINLAFVGNKYRLDSFLKCLGELNPERIGTVFVRNDVPDIRNLVKDFPFNFEFVPIEANYHQFIFRWRNLGAHFLIHSRMNLSVNREEKSRSILATSCLIGAIPVVFDEPAFAGIPASYGLKIIDSEKRIREIEALGLDESRRNALYSSLVAFVAEEFGSEQGLAWWVLFRESLPQVTEERRCLRLLQREEMGSAIVHALRHEMALIIPRLSFYDRHFSRFFGVWVRLQDARSSRDLARILLKAAFKAFLLTMRAFLTLFGKATAKVHRVRCKPNRVPGPHAT